MDKKCPKCTLIKLREEYYKNKYSFDGLASYCKSCMKLYNAEPARKKLNRDRRKIYRLTEKAQQRRKEILHSPVGRWQQFVRGSKCDYGITEIEYLKLLWKTKGQCYNSFCSTLGVNETRGLFIDHDHQTGKIRGLLCQACNTALGHLHDNINKIIGLKDYLEIYGIKN